MSPPHREDIKPPGVILAFDKAFEGRILLRPNGTVRLYWTPLEDEMPMEELKNQTEIFNKLYHKCSEVVKLPITTFVEKVSRLYFMSGVISFLFCILFLSLGFAFLAFAMNDSILPVLQCFLVSFCYFMIFVHAQRKHLGTAKSDFSRDFKLLAEPLVYFLSHTDRKIVEFFVILFLIFFMMGVTFSKCIPPIMEFWRHHFGEGNELLKSGLDQLRISEFIATLRI
ncbi:MAG: hypothetical protein PHW04_18145 [Candidatus Wallbacteria bacterium]|nr:hypothetical protein [Candidatus Wallbacteria bacterium]